MSSNTNSSRTWGAGNYQGINGPPPPPPPTSSSALASDYYYANNNKNKNNNYYYSNPPSLHGSETSLDGGGGADVSGGGHGIKNKNGGEAITGMSGQASAFLSSIQHQLIYTNSSEFNSGSSNRGPSSSYYSNREDIIAKQKDRSYRDTDNNYEGNRSSSSSSSSSSSASSPSTHDSSSSSSNRRDSSKSGNYGARDERGSGSRSSRDYSGRDSGSGARSTRGDGLRGDDYSRISSSSFSNTHRDLDQPDDARDGGGYSRKDAGSSSARYRDDFDRRDSSSRENHRAGERPYSHRRRSQERDNLFAAIPSINMRSQRPAPSSSVVIKGLLPEQTEDEASEDGRIEFVSKICEINWNIIASRRNHSNMQQNSNQCARGEG